MSNKGYTDADIVEIVQLLKDIKSVLRFCAAIGNALKWLALVAASIGGSWMIFKQVVKELAK